MVSGEKAKDERFILNVAEGSDISLSIFCNYFTVTGVMVVND
jgi:hypothetical protein